MGETPPEGPLLAKSEWIEVLGEALEEGPSNEFWQGLLRVHDRLMRNNQRRLVEALQRFVTLTDTVPVDAGFRTLAIHARKLFAEMETRDER